MPTTTTTDATESLVPTSLNRSGRDGGDADSARVEELLRQGLRPKDARRIEELERTLDLPDEEEELNRVRAAAMLRANPSKRDDVVAAIIEECVAERVTEYDALCRLQALEIVPEGCGFARFINPAHGKSRFVCYEGTEPRAAFRYIPPRFGNDSSATEIDAEKQSPLPS